jgi:hypothetical protein
MTEKIWAVTLTDGYKVTQVELFDNENDADNYAQEMAQTGKGNYQVTETTLNVRNEVIEGEPRWAELTSFNTDCIECLVNEIDTTQGKPVDTAACAAFLEENKEKIRNKANEMVREYIRKTVNDYVNDERIILG